MTRAIRETDCDLLSAAGAVRDASLCPLDGCEYCTDPDCASRCDYCGGSSAGGQRCSCCGSFVCEIEAMYVGDAREARGLDRNVGPSAAWEATNAVRMAVARGVLYLAEILPDVPVDYERYATCEREVIAPALVAAGYTLLGAWHTGDGDSFGPLTRCVATDRGTVVYG